MPTAFVAEEFIVDDVAYTVSDPVDALKCKLMIKLIEKLEQSR